MAGTRVKVGVSQIQIPLLKSAYEFAASGAERSELVREVKESA